MMCCSINKSLAALPLFLLLLICACSSFTPAFPESQSWSALEADRIAATVWIAPVVLEKAGAWPTAADEAAGLLPLMFLEHNFKAVKEKAGAAYIAALTLREHEIGREWKTRVSLSVELRLWSAGTEADEREHTAPLAAGRVLLQGNQSFSSSKTLSRLLKRAVEKAIWALPEGQKTNRTGGEGAP
jgi:hypothetical protein